MKVFLSAILLGILLFLLVVEGDSSSADGELPPTRLQKSCRNTCYQDKAKCMQRKSEVEAALLQGSVYPTSVELHLLLLQGRLR